MDDVVMHLLLSLCYKQKPGHNALLIYKFSLVLLLI